MRIKEEEKKKFDKHQKEEEHYRIKKLQNPNKTIVPEQSQLLEESLRKIIENKRKLDDHRKKEQEEILKKLEHQNKKEDNDKIIQLESMLKKTMEEYSQLKLMYQDTKNEEENIKNE